MRKFDNRHGHILTPKKSLLFKISKIRKKALGRLTIATHRAIKHPFRTSGVLTIACKRFRIFPYKMLFFAVFVPYVNSPASHNA